MNAVAAGFRDRYGDIDQLLGQWVEMRWLGHHFLGLRPRVLKECGIEREGSPKVVDEICLSSGTHVVEDCLDARVGFRVPGRFDCGHVDVSFAVCSRNVNKWPKSDGSSAYSVRPTFGGRVRRHRYSGISGSTRVLSCASDSCQPR